MCRRMESRPMSRSAKLYQIVCTVSYFYNLRVGARTSDPKKKSTPEEPRFIPGFRFGSLTFWPGGCGMMPSRPALAGLRFNSLNTQSLKDLVGFVTWVPS